jgi:precorrin-6B methylase 2
MKDTTDAALIYRHFRQLPGSEYIASEHAIAGLVKWLIRKQPRQLLEVGAGIGTLTFTCLATLQQIKARVASYDFQLTSLEGNAFCLSALQQNLSEQWGRFELTQNSPAFAALPTRFDFVIIDGGEQDSAFVSKVAPRGIIYIEGFMGKKHELIAATHRQRPYVGTNFRSKDRKSSYWIYQFEPRLPEIIWFGANTFYNRIRSRLQRWGKYDPESAKLVK